MPSCNKIFATTSLDLHSIDLSPQPTNLFLPRAPGSCTSIQASKTSVPLQPSPLALGTPSPWPIPRWLAADRITLPFACSHRIEQTPSFERLHTPLSCAHMADRVRVRPRKRADELKVRRSSRKQGAMAGYSCTYFPFFSDAPPPLVCSAILGLSVSACPLFLRSTSQDDS